MKTGGGGVKVWSCRKKETVALSKNHRRRQFHQLKQGGDGCNLVNGCGVGGWRLRERGMKSGDPEKHRIKDKVMAARHPIERGAPGSLRLSIPVPHRAPFSSSLEFSFDRLMGSQHSWIYWKEEMCFLNMFFAKCTMKNRLARGGKESPKHN